VRFVEGDSVRIRVSGSRLIEGTLVSESREGVAVRHDGNVATLEWPKIDTLWAHRRSARSGAVLGMKVGGVSLGLASLLLCIKVGRDRPDVGDMPICEGTATHLQVGVVGGFVGAVVGGIFGALNGRGEWRRVTP
jgi:hypothetical protein